MSDKMINRDNGFRSFLFILMILILPVALPLLSIKDAIRIELGSNPTPWGYTISLVIYIIPVIALLIWFIKNPSFRFHQKAFWYTFIIITVLAFLLDVFFAKSFFVFPNRNATLNIPYILGFDFATFSFVPAFPIEEFGFYTTGILFVLLVYNWLDIYWLKAYDPDFYYTHSPKMKKMISIHYPSIIIALLVIVVSFVIVEYIETNYERFPGYMLFLMSIFIVISSLFKTVRFFVNWRAMSMLIIIVWLTSVIWEVTLAVPYQWWGFNENAMLGLFIKGWYNLPIEEPFLWTIIGWSVVLVFESFKIYFTRSQE